MSQINKDPDPGGSQGNPNREITDLKDQNEQQQVLIAQLKEMLRKSDQQTNVTEDKMHEYIKTLNRKKKSKFQTGDVSSANIDSNKKERLNLLKQQMEENKAKLAERGKSQKGLEEMVSQLTVQLNDSQNLITQSSLNISIQEGNKMLDYTKNTSQEELYNILLIKEKKITELGNKVQKLEGNVLDLQENLKEKDSVIDARTKAITLMTESLSLKGKSTLDELTETKEQMQKMQENFINLEQDMKQRQLKLLEDLKMKNNEILDLQEANEKLQKEKLNIQIQLDEKLKYIEDLQKVETPKKELSPKNSPSRNRKGKKGKNQKKEDSPPIEESNTSKLELEIEELKKINEEILKNNKSEELNMKIDELNKNIEELKELNEELTQQNNTILEENTNLKQKHQNIIEENENFVKKIQILEKETSESLEELNQLKDKMREKIITDSSSSRTEDSEVTKLKKQLEENNKNTIKIKATHNAKIKDLNKKLNTFKKMNDSNALILQLQNEISKLEQKIAELEDEKGNLQLKMVESTESLKEESTLIAENKNLQSTIQSLQEKLSTISQEKTEQVQSEISSIQFEEKLEIIEKEKEAVLTEKQSLECKCTEMAEKLEILTKEKTELSAKLENYIQENMELIDKLEKLSAEKVSSAESIEIVEGLTQQEKIDFAAYEKNMEITEEMRMEASDTPMDQSSEPPEELNETVLQLNEETTELLQKIEMFNVERKEVMLKLDNLKEENEKLLEELKEFEKVKEENSQLSVQLKQVENNRDVLEETYEQLQTEKEVLEKEIQGLKSELKNNTSVADLEEKLEKLIKENDELKHALKTSKENVPEQDTELQNNFEIAKNNCTELEEKLKQTREEIENYKLIIEENKEELINSSKTINELHQKITEKDKIIQEGNSKLEELSNNVEDLNDTITEMKKLHENEIDLKYNEYIQFMEEQLKEVKESLNNHIEQAEENEKELNECHEIINKLNSELKELNLRVLNYQEMIENKNKELEKLNEDISEQESFIKTLEDTIHKKSNEISIKDKTINEKDEKFNNLTAELTEKFLKLQQQMDTNNATLESKITELQNKNKELMEKLKKYAANLKKKTQEFKDLQLQLTNNEDLQKQIQLLEENNVQLQNQILQMKEEKTNTLSLKQEFSNIQEKSEDNFNNPDEIQESKIKELEMIIETQENEITTYKEKIQRLEEGLSNLEERRLSLERTNVALGDKLTESSISFEEKSLEEEQLEQKMGVLLLKDDELTKKIDNLQMDNEELNLRNSELCQEQSKLIHKINDLETQLFNSQQELDFTKTELQKPIHNLENQIKQLQNEKESIQRQNKAESVKYENEIQLQMEELLNTKNSLQIQNEKLQETLQNLTEHNNDLQSQLEDLKDQLLDSRSTTKQVEALQETKAQLKLEIQTLKLELIQSTASKTIDEVITEAKSEVASREASQKTSKEASPIHEAETVPTFNWSSFNAPPQNEATNWFAEATPPEASEELQKKVKTLEFMLYNVEKEKDNALLQCHELTNELTRLVYEREQKGANFEAIEAQIVSPEDIVDTAGLKQLEFEATKPLESQVEAVEEIVTKKDAYKCFDEATASGVPQGLESQILSPNEANSDTRDLQSLEFQPVTDEAKDEALAVKSEAYQCFMPENEDVPPRNPQNDPQASSSIEGLIVDDNDDGWGWGPEEAKKEEAYMLKTSAVTEITDLKGQIDSLNEQIRVFELERESHLEEIKTLQVKSGKLIKKCKEFKLKYEQVSKKDPTTQKEDDFFNLDNAIQEELKTQVEKLEKTLKETSIELEKEKLEKTQIVKKLDTLTTANEKFLKIKERQDFELMNLQRKYDELQNADWGNPNVTPEKKSIVTEVTSDVSNKKYEESRLQVEELKETLKDIMLDNEELQSLLEEQKNLRNEAENKLKTLTVTQDNVISEKEFIELKNQKQKIENDFDNLQTQFKELQTSLATLQEEISQLQNDKQLLESQIQQSKSLEEYDILLNERNNLKEQFDVLNQTYQDELLGRTNLETRYQHVGTNYENITREITDLRNEKDDLLSDVSTKISVIENLNQEKLELENKVLTLQESLKEVEILQAKIISLEQQNSDQKTSVFDLNNQPSFFDEIAIPTVENKTSGEDLVKLQQDLENLQEVNQDLTTQIQDLTTQIQDLKSANIALLQNEQELISTYQKNLEITVDDLNKKWEEECISRGDVIAETWKLHLETVETEFSQVQSKLQLEVNELEEKCNGLVNENNELRKNVDTEIRNEVDKISALQQQITNGQKTIAELNALLQQKEADFMQLQNTVLMLQSELDQYKNLLQEKENKLDSINVVIETTMKQFDEKRLVVEEVVKILEKNSGYVLSLEKNDIVGELEKQLSSKNDVDIINETLNTKTEQLQEALKNLEDYKLKLDTITTEHNLALQNLTEADKKITDLTSKLQILEDLKNDSNKGVHNLENELSQAKSDLIMLQNSLEETQSSLFETAQNYSTKCQEYDDLILEIKTLKQAYNSKEQACGELQALLNNNQSQNTEETLRTQLRDLENHYENILLEKQNDFQSLTSINQNLQDQLNQSQQYQQYQLKCTELEHHIGELNAYIQGQNERLNEQNLNLVESQKQAEDMQIIIEQQVGKIEELKQEVFSKSNEFDSFVAQMENIIPGTITKQPVSLPDKSRLEGEESVSRAEHDLALYMLHQRDVRCEELTEELTHLLEERDLLQLRLSIAIREKEELRRKTGEDSATAPGGSGNAASGSQQSPSKSSAIFMAASGIEMGKEPLEEDTQHLVSKLSELKSVGYKKDKTFVDERRKLAIMQEHINEASKLPPEAAQKLVDASYTLSRDVQSPSKVLLNWLWGRSTPKVNDT